MGFGDAVASAGPYANNLHLTPDRWPLQHLITQCFTGQMHFLTGAVTISTVTIPTGRQSDSHHSDRFIV